MGRQEGGKGEQGFGCPLAWCSAMRFAGNQVSFLEGTNRGSSDRGEVREGTHCKVTCLSGQRNKG